MSSALKDQIQEEMKAAMRAKDKERLSTIRMILAAIKQREIDERITLDDTQVVAVLEKMTKQRRDSIQQYEAAGREELAEIERQELEVIQAYMPAQLGEAEIEAHVANAITELGAAGPQDMGKVMGVLKGRLQGQADMGKVSQLVKSKLTSS